MFAGMFGILVVVALGVVGLALYFLPSIIAWNKRNSGAIIALNILLGWTFIGWVVALVWSLTADQPSVVL
ncbi:MAG: superinfection immunity protein, partial [Candidatus Sulfotelmatobacter sp.]